MTYKYDRVRRSRVPTTRPRTCLFSCFGTLLTACVGEEICRLSEEEVDRKTLKTVATRETFKWQSTTGMTYYHSAWLLDKLPEREKKSPTWTVENAYPVNSPFEKESEMVRIMLCTI